jgi:hypothetical protein
MDKIVPAFVNGTSTKIECSVNEPWTHLGEPANVMAFIWEITSLVNRDLWSVEAGSHLCGPAWFPYKRKMKFSKK